MGETRGNFSSRFQIDRYVEIKMYASLENIHTHTHTKLMIVKFERKRELHTKNRKPAHQTKMLQKIGSLNELSLQITDSGLQ